MTRVLRRTTGSYTFTAAAIGDDGSALAITAPVTATLYDGAGLQLATTTPTINGGSLEWTIAASLLPALDAYTITWTGTAGGQAQSWTTDVELVGGHHFTIAELRAMDRAFADTTKYPAEALRAVRDAVEDTIEGPRAAQLAFVPRYSRVAVDGSAPDFTRGYSPLMYGNDFRGLKVPDFNVRQVYSVVVNGTALTPTELAGLSVDDNTIWRSGGVQWPSWPFGRRNIALHYEHGLDRVPGPIKRAALILAKEYLVTSPIPGRATATSIGDQMFRLTVAGRDGVTGLPEVDAAIDQFGRKGFGIG